MERNEPTVCEKLFNAFHMHPSFRPLRRLTFRQQADQAPAGAPVAPNSSPSSLPDRPAGHSSGGTGASDHSSPSPPPPPPATKPKPPAPVATIKVDAVPPPAPSAPVPKERAQQLPNVIPKAGSNSTTDQAANIPTPTAPAGVARGSGRPTAETAAPPAPQKTAVPVPQPAPPPGAERARRSVNEKAEDYIARARNKIRTGTGIGRAPTSK